MLFSYILCAFLSVYYAILKHIIYISFSLLCYSHTYYVHFFQFIMLFSWIKYTDMEGEAFPEWADVLGWLMTMSVVVAIVVGAILTICTAEGTFGQVY